MIIKQCPHHSHQQSSMSKNSAIVKIVDEYLVRFQNRSRCSKLTIRLNELLLLFNYFIITACLFCTYLRCVHTNLTYYEEIISMRVCVPHFFPGVLSFTFVIFSIVCSSLSLFLSLSPPFPHVLSVFSVFCYLPSPLHETSLASSRVIEAQTTRAK